MKVRARGVYTTTMPDGTLVSPVPGAVFDVDVDDADTAVADHWRYLAGKDMADIVEDAAQDVNDIAEHKVALQPSPADAKEAVTDPPTAHTTPGASSEPAAPPVSGPAGTGTGPYAGRTLPELQETARRRNLPTTGGKDDLIARLREVRA